MKPRMLVAAAALGLAIGVADPTPPEPALRMDIQYSGPLIAKEAIPRLGVVTDRLPSYIGWLWCSSGHARVRCQYPDETAGAANDFRSQRDRGSLTGYLTGRAGGGECDTVVTGTRPHVCYGGSSDQSEETVKTHGPIAAI